MSQAPRSSSTTHDVNEARRRPPPGPWAWHWASARFGPRADSFASVTGSPSSGSSRSSTAASTYLLIGKVLGETELGLDTLAFRLPELVILNVAILAGLVSSLRSRRSGERDRRRLPDSARLRDDRVHAAGGHVLRPRRAPGPDRLGSGPVGGRDPGNADLEPVRVRADHRDARRVTPTRQLRGSTC